MLGAGAVLHVTAKSKFTELGGLARYMPWTFVFYMVGAFSISGVPLFNGFISKSMIIAGAALEHQPVIETLLVMASIGTFLCIGVKIPYGAKSGSSSEWAALREGRLGRRVGTQRAKTSSSATGMSTQTNSV